MATQIYSDYSGSISQPHIYYDKNLLMRALPNLVFYKFGQKRSLKKNSGNQISFRRFNSLSVATTALTDGVTPEADALSITEVLATMAQYGNFIKLSDNIDCFSFDPVIMETTDLLGENAGQTVDTLSRDVVKAGSQVTYATGTTRVEQLASSPITRDLVRKAVRTLEVNDATPFMGSQGDNGQGGTWLGIIHPRAWYDLYGDTAYEATFQYSDPEKLYKGMLPVADGVAWYKTTYAPIFAGEGASSADVYGTLIFGKESFGITELSGKGKFETITKPLGSAGTEDPLNQRSAVGWKGWHVSKILNNNFMIRIEAGVSA